MKNEEKILKHYQGEYSDERYFSTCYAESDEQAIRFLEDEECGTLWNVFEIDEDYNIIRTVY